MDKRWYPAALTLALMGCGGSSDSGTGKPGDGGVDSGTPSATGGMPTVRYGVLLTGGTSSSTIDAGMASAVGGQVTTLYGVLP